MVLPGNNWISLLLLAGHLTLSWLVGYWTNDFETQIRRWVLLDLSLWLLEMTDHPPLLFLCFKLQVVIKALNVIEHLATSPQVGPLAKHLANNCDEVLEVAENASSSEGVRTAARKVCRFESLVV